MSRLNTLSSWKDRWPALFAVIPFLIFLQAPVLAQTDPDDADDPDDEEEIAGELPDQAVFLPNRNSIENQLRDDEWLGGSDKNCRARISVGESVDHAFSTAMPDSLRENLKDRDLEFNEPGARIPYDIPVTYNGKVEEWVHYFQGRGRKYYHKWLQRYTRYAPVMREILREHKLPEDTVYLAMIESGFSTFALSTSAAGGIWQFIPATAKRYGLKIDYWRDERRDPIKSTRAAAMYLRDLYQYFGSWWLAWAGYNSGEGKIFKALRKYDTEDFWELSNYRFLKAETKNYVPKLIAAAIMARDPARYGFDDVEYFGRMEFDVAEIPSPADLRVVAKAALTDLEVIETLNPELRRGCTPPDQPTYMIRIPKGSKEMFVAVFNAVPVEDRMKVEEYLAKRGDTVSKVAKARGVKPALVSEFNGLGAKSATASLKAGTELRIPLVYVRDEETEEKWDKKLQKSKSKSRKKSKKARKVVTNPVTQGLPEG